MPTEETPRDPRAVFIEECARRFIKAPWQMDDFIDDNMAVLKSLPKEEKERIWKVMREAARAK